MTYLHFLISTIPKQSFCIYTLALVTTQKTNYDLLLPSVISFLSFFFDWRMIYLACLYFISFSRYSYPPPDGNILTNIVNALIAVPRFYTQVK